jgi:hypothetical protein
MQKKILSPLLFVVLASSCNLSISPSSKSGSVPVPEPYPATEFVPVVPACGLILRELITNKYKDEANPATKLDQDLNSASGISFDQSQLTDAQKNCLAELRDGDFLASVETSLKYYEAVRPAGTSSCENGGFIFSSVETSLKFAEACNHTYQSPNSNFVQNKNWMNSVRVVSSVETYLKYAEAVMDSGYFNHSVLASVETYLKAYEASIYNSNYDYLMESFQASGQGNYWTYLQANMASLLNQPGAKNINLGETRLLASVETYLKFAEYANYSGRYYSELSPHMLIHVPTQETLAKLNEAFDTAGNFSLSTDSNLLNLVGPVTANGCNGQEFDLQRINEKGIVQLGSSLGGLGGANLLASLGFSFSSSPCNQGTTNNGDGTAVPAIVARDLLDEDYNRLIDKGVVMQKDFPITFLSKIAFGGDRMLDKGIVLKSNLSSSDLNIMSGHFLSGNEYSKETQSCDWVGDNYVCGDYYYRPVPQEEQADRMLDKGFVAMDLPQATLLRHVLIGDSSQYPLQASRFQMAFAEAVDRLMDKGVAGTNKASVLGAMFVDKNLFENDFFDLVLDRGVYFDGEKFLSIEYYLLQREAEMGPPPA